jgi:Flp pilus assembly protein TadD
MAGTDRWRNIAVILFVASLCSFAEAAEVRLKLPKKAKPTPVQELNLAGVKALNHNDIATARRDFYRAYLLDPDDPFTLNNLGYIAELDGEVSRAQKFYDLAAATGSSAVVKLSSNPEVEGKEVSKIAGGTVSSSLRVNRDNVAAMGLIMKNRAPEAELLLRKDLVIDPRNPFTLNNLGYVLEKEGELEQAARLYQQASASGSNEKVIVALNRSWHGRSISEVAGKNATAARSQLDSEGTEERVARLNLRGVSALNRNQPAQARSYFQEAARLDPGNAFSLNNMGYLAETEGDQETADFYYQKARTAYRNTARVALATHKSMQGMQLASVASENQQSVESAEERQLAALRAQGVPPLPLRTRDQAFVREPAARPRPAPEIPVRIVAEDNPPAERPQSMAAPAGQRAATPAQPKPATVGSAAAARAPSAAASRPAGTEAVRTTQPTSDDQQPLLPVIPDEAPAPRR